MLNFVFRYKWAKVRYFIFQLAFLLPMLSATQEPGVMQDVMQDSAGQDAAAQMPEGAFGMGSIDLNKISESFQSIFGDAFGAGKMSIEDKEKMLTSLSQEIREAYEDTMDKHADLLKSIELKYGLSGLCNKIEVKLEKLAEQKQNSEFSQKVGDLKNRFEKFKKALEQGNLVKYQGELRLKQFDISQMLQLLISGGIDPKNQGQGQKEASKFESSDFAELFTAISSLLGDIKSDMQTEKNKTLAQLFASFYNIASSIQKAQDATNNYAALIKEREDLLKPIEQAFLFAKDLVEQEAIKQIKELDTALSKDLATVSEIKDEKKQADQSEKFKNEYIQKVDVIKSDLGRSIFEDPATKAYIKARETLLVKQLKEALDLRSNSYRVLVVKYLNYIEPDVIKTTKAFNKIKNLLAMEIARVDDLEEELESAESKLDKQNEDLRANCKKLQHDVSETLSSLAIFMNLRNKLDVDMSRVFGVLSYAYDISKSFLALMKDDLRSEVCVKPPVKIGPVKIGPVEIGPIEIGPDMPTELNSAGAKYFGIKIYEWALKLGLVYLEHKNTNSYVADFFLENYVIDGFQVAMPQMVKSTLTSAMPVLNLEKNAEAKIMQMYNVAMQLKSLYYFVLPGALSPQMTWYKDDLKRILVAAIYSQLPNLKKAVRGDAGSITWENWWQKDDKHIKNEVLKFCFEAASYGSERLGYKFYSMFPKFLSICEKYSLGVVNPQMFQYFAMKMLPVLIYSVNPCKQFVDFGDLSGVNFKGWQKADNAMQLIEANGFNTPGDLEKYFQHFKEKQQCGQALDPLLRLPDHLSIDENVIRNYVNTVFSKPGRDNSLQKLESNFGFYCFESCVVSYIFSQVGLTVGRLIAQKYHHPIVSTTFKVADFMIDKVSGICQSVGLLDAEGRETWEEIRLELSKVGSELYGQLAMFTKVLFMPQSPFRSMILEFIKTSNIAIIDMKASQEVIDKQLLEALLTFLKKKHFVDYVDVYKILNLYDKNVERNKIEMMKTGGVSKPIVDDELVNMIVDKTVGNALSTFFGGGLGELFGGYVANKVMERGTIGDGISLIKSKASSWFSSAVPAMP